MRWSGKHLKCKECNKTVCYECGGCYSCDCNMSCYSHKEKHFGKWFADGERLNENKEI